MKDLALAIVTVGCLWISVEYVGNIPAVILGSLGFGAMGARLWYRAGTP